MKVAAFDAKPFERSSPARSSGSGERGGRRGFRTQLGAGIVVSDKEEFKDRFATKFAELRDEFKIMERVPFCPSSRLLKYGLPKAISFSDQLVSSVQDLIENLHCFYVILPPTDPDTVRVGVTKNEQGDIPTWLFMRNLGPMFSYMTAHDYLYKNSGLDVSNIEFHIDAFVSKQTRSWEKVVSRVNPKIFWRGDECNPFIACADIMAFLTDVKLYGNYLLLSRENIINVWEDYQFKTTVHYVDRGGISIHVWRSDRSIDVWPYAAKPTVFLAIDSLTQDNKTEKNDEGGDAGLNSMTSDKQSTTKSSASKVFVESPVYAAAVQYAFKQSASLKFFNRYEDSAHVCDRDVFVYIGPESERVGRMLQYASRVTIMSGLELRDKVEK